MTVQPNVVCEYMIGNTRVKIADNFFVGKTEEDIQKIIRRATEVVNRSMTAAVIEQAQ